ncbi:MAG: hypothetical protein ACE5JF_02170 [Anaerolineales bacterium]
MGRRRRSILKIISSLAVLTLMASLVGCEFEPDIDPLILPDAPPQAFQSDPEGGNEIVETEPETAGGGAIELAGFKSAQAIAQCGDQLTWGNEKVGICDVPGRNAFYVWNSPDQVLEVAAGNPYLLNIQLAAEARIAAEEGFKDSVVEVGLGLAGFVVELVLLGPACATIILCALDAGALTVTGVAIANSADSGVEDFQTFLDSTQNAGFYFCLIQGSSESYCRDTHIVGDAP